MKKIILAISLISLYTIGGFAADSTTILCLGDINSRYFGKHNPQVKIVNFKYRTLTEEKIQSYYEVSLKKISASADLYGSAHTYSTMLKDSEKLMDIEMYINTHSDVTAGVMYSLVHVETGLKFVNYGALEMSNSFLDIFDVNNKPIVNIICKFYSTENGFYTRVP